MNDNRIKDRVNELIAGGPAADQPRPAEQPEMPADDEGQPQTLQVLMLAQRTADEHIAGARQQADKIHAQAQTTAEQIVRDAQTRAAVVLREADEARSQARAAAEQIVSDAQAQADQARRTAETIVSEARTRAEEIAADAQAKADELDNRAQLHHEDFVGSMAATQEAVQQQIQALEHFDRDYRAQLVRFVQAQLRALAVDAEHIDAEQPGTAATSGPQPQPQPGPTATTENTADTAIGPGSNNPDGTARRTGAVATTEPSQLNRDSRSSTGIEAGGERQSGGSDLLPDVHSGA